MGSIPTWRAIFTQMIKVAEGAVSLKVSGPVDELRALRKAFQYQPENYWRADSYQIYLRSNGAQGWDGYLRPFEFVRGASDRAKLMRGYLSDLIQKCEELSIEVCRDELLARPFAGMTPDDVPTDAVASSFELDEAQRACIAAWLSSAIGINYVTVSGGKTVMFCAAAALIKKRYPDARFLYFTQTERLVNQVFSEAKKFLPDWGITQYGGGKKDPTGSDLVVATGSMLGRNFKQLEKDGWFKTFMAVLIDEAHHASSPTWTKVLESVPAFFRLGASDTRKEDDLVAWNKIRGLIGPRLEEVKMNDLIEQGRVAKPFIRLIDEPTWSGMFSGVTHAAEEHSQAFALLNGVWKKGTYLGPVYEHDPESEDGFKYDRKGNRVSVINLHTILIDELEYEVESRYCLLDRVRDKAIITFKERNNEIVGWVHEYAEVRKLPTLVVCTPTLHILILEALIKKKLGDPERVRILYSDHTTAERDEAFEWLKSTPGSVLISSLVKEGVSINELRAGVVADYVAGWEVARQIIGRFVRKKPDGENVAHITMFVERQHPKLFSKSVEMFERLAKSGIHFDKSTCTYSVCQKQN